MQYTEQELTQLIETVEQQFTAHLTKAETLAKSEGVISSPAPLVKAEEKPAEKKDEKPAESKEGEKPSEPKEGEKPAEPKAEAGKEAPHAEAKPADGKEGEKPAEGAPGHSESGYDDEDRAHMDNMYSSMSRSELMEHHDSCRRALDKCGDMSMGKSEIKDENPVLNSKPTEKGSETNTAYNENSGGKMEASAPHNSPGAKSPASKAEGMQMEKSEKNEVELLKSELEAEKAKTEAVKEFLTKFVSKISAPKGKAITEISAITKSEDVTGGTGASELSKSEITEKLLKKAQDPTLSKSDREAINSFYLNGSTNVNTISHLLK